ncbi:BrnT family toxin [Acidicapsa acidisoli]|uniref:BrnT family toxin n=1 Tax=Acidicapsa acidisoli TaxID=1615681 RepID=UPI0021E0A235|nr:BrnT family toxin [Acidicapsa acidisoli]
MPNSLQNSDSIFDWDDANIGHIADHEVTPEEAEQVLLGDPLEVNFDPDRNGEERWTYLGETERGRILTVIITLRSEKMRVVTAFDAESRDKLLYLKTKAGWNDGSENP